MALVLVTGAGGEVAQGVLPFLEKHFELRLLSLEPRVPQDPRWVQADVLNWQDLARTMQGVDAVLHLAVASGHSGTYENDAFNDLRFDVNVRGTYHVFEAARRSAVRRVVHVSSVMATWGHALQRGRRRKLIPGDVEAFPVGTYALTKALGEDVARYYSRNLDVPASFSDPRRGLQRVARPMQVITLRIGAPLDVSDPTLRTRSVRPQQVPVPDLAQAFRRALTVRLKQFHIVTIVGHSAQTAWDLGPARRILGYKPRYNLDEMKLTFAAEPFLVAPS